MKDIGYRTQKNHGPISIVRLYLSKVAIDGHTDSGIVYETNDHYYLEWSSIRTTYSITKEEYDELKVSDIAYTPKYEG